MPIVPHINFFFSFLQVEEDVVSSTKKLMEMEPVGLSRRQSARTKGEVKYYGESVKEELPKKQRGKKALPKPVPFEEEGEKAVEPPKAVAKRGKRTEPSAFEEKSRGGKKAVDAAKSTGQFCLAIFTTYFTIVIQFCISSFLIRHCR